MATLNLISGKTALTHATVPETWQLDIVRLQFLHADFHFLVFSMSVLSICKNHTCMTKHNLIGVASFLSTFPVGQSLNTVVEQVINDISCNNRLSTDDEKTSSAILIRGLVSPQHPRIIAVSENRMRTLWARAIATSDNISNEMIIPTLRPIFEQAISCFKRILAHNLTVHSTHYTRILIDLLC